MVQPDLARVAVLMRAAVSDPVEDGSAGLAKVPR
jgi:hypothetical protein